MISAITAIKIMIFSTLHEQTRYLQPSLIKYADIAKMIAASKKRKSGLLGSREPIHFTFFL